MLLSLGTLFKLFELRHEPSESKMFFSSSFSDSNCCRISLALST